MIVHICFNPRPRAGGDFGHIAWDKYRKVSIHAPARGATISTRERPRNSRVSIHAPARGATMSISTKPPFPRFQSTPPRGGRPLMSARCGPSFCFNPRPRAGGDLDDLAFRVGGKVSIHAPARGATSPPPVGSLVSSGFNPRPRAGGDLTMYGIRSEIVSFNPRPRAGGDEALA